MWSKPIIFFIVFFIFIIYTNFKDSIEQFSNLKTVVLLGDSMLDNELYVGEKKSVYDQIKMNINTKNAFNFAQDNSVIKDCYNQIKNIPKTFNRESTYIFLSVGGNDIINAPDITKDEEKLEELQTSYINLIQHIKNQFPRANLIVLNIYKPFASYYRMFYDVINKWNTFLIKNKIYEYEVADVEKIINEKDDLVNDIEPSESGGKKIADVIISFVK